MGEPDGARSFFEADSPYPSHPLLTEERTAQELDQIEALVGSIRGPVLDLGCGFGRHVIELGRREIAATGVDPSSHMIDEANRRLAASGLSADLRTLRAHEFIDDQSYNLGLCLFTTFGQQDPHLDEPSDDSTVGLLQAASRALAPNAPLIVEVPDRERTVALLAQDEWLGPTHVRRDFADDGGVREVFDGPSGRFHLAYRAFGSDDLTALFEENGFAVETVLPRALVEPPGHLMTVIARNSA